MFGKQTEAGIIALGRLAQVYDGGATRLSASEVASETGLQAPFIAKTLSVLAHAGLLDGAPGPGGGYRLARPPTEIRLSEIAAVFHGENSCLERPLLGEVFAKVFPQALTLEIQRAHDALCDLMERTTLDAFTTA